MHEWERDEEEIGTTLDEGEGEVEIRILIYQEYVDKIKDGDVVVMERRGRDETIVARVRLPSDWNTQPYTSCPRPSRSPAKGKCAIIKVETGTRLEIGGKGKFQNVEWPIGIIPAGEPVRGYGEERLLRGW